MRFRLLPSFGDLFASVRFIVILAVLVGALGALAIWRPSLNPFRVETVDRTGASVLRSLTDLSEFHAASAHYETVVDRAKDTDSLPGWVSGERVIYVAKGDVDAIVDFGELDERRVATSEDGMSVTIRLPAPAADKPVLDLGNSYVADHDIGFINRFMGSDLQRETQLKAIAQMTTAAAAEGTLIDRARENTIAMLRGLLGSLGYTNITITFDENGW